jgi:hypothetical protein
MTVATDELQQRSAGRSSSSRHLRSFATGVALQLTGALD